MPVPLPQQPSLEWLKKTAKQLLRQLRAHNPAVRLTDAQLAVARRYGFDSWRKLKRHVEQLHRASSESPERPPVSLADEEAIKRFFTLVGSGEIEGVRQILADSPDLVNAVGPHPFWGGRPQALHVAIETNRRQVYDLLIQAGADVNGINDQYDHWSPLMIAINKNRPDMRDDLIRRGARIGLTEALLLGDDALVEELLRSGKPAIPANVPNGGSFLTSRVRLSPSTASLNSALRSA